MAEPGSRQRTNWLLRRQEHLAGTRRKEDFYALFGVDRQARGDEIKKSYRKLAMKHHPD
ncbi:MAG: DnaJ domain-containing protein, partial [Gemmatimonadetes bacterium]|nr:DnaJ domain-containing protein [Gemmatimonadota bacterium]